MTKPTLFVCKSCSAKIAPDDVTEDTVTEGALLLEQLQELQKGGSTERTLDVQSVGCLWTCDRPCSASFACPEKYTYHFAGLNYPQSAAELQQFSQLYMDSPDGYVKPTKMPQELRSRLLVRIPPVKQTASEN